MNRTEHLLWILSEECAEVAQRASKAARFGLEEIQPGHPLTNAERIAQELHDLMGAVEKLEEAGALPRIGNRVAIDAKKDKIELFLAYSRSCGTLT